MNENEIWLPVVGFEGLYQVSNTGKVKSLKFGKEKILKQGKMKNDYLHVGLCKEGKRKNCYVHRLVANAFLENPNNYTCVNHKDENPSNNQVDNLEWCTQKYNVNFGTCIQRRVSNTDYKARTAKIDYKARTAKMDYKAISEKQRNNPNKSKQVFQYTKDGTLVAIWQSTMECGRNGFDQSSVAKCCRGEAKTHKGFIWSYTELKKQES